MFKNKAANGKRNLAGDNIAKLRKGQALSQKGLADKLQLAGLDLGKNAIQKIESGERFITDVELKAFSVFFGVSCDALLQ